jgi:hypothetical protein
MMRKHKFTFAGASHVDVVEGAGRMSRAWFHLDLQGSM